MGIKFNKFEPLIIGESFPLHAVDAFKVGFCYLCVHEQKELSEKQKHHSLIIDVSGETRFDIKGSIDKLIGYMLHVTANPLTGRTKYCYGRVEICGNNESIHTVGRLNNTLAMAPYQHVSQLHNIASNFTVSTYYFVIMFLFLGCEHLHRSYSR